MDVLGMARLGAAGLGGARHGMAWILSVVRTLLQVRTTLNLENSRP
jgi:hypothetical protein